MLNYRTKHVCVQIKLTKCFSLWLVRGEGDMINHIRSQNLVYSLYLRIQMVWTFNISNLDYLINRTQSLKYQRFTTFAKNLRLMLRTPEKFTVYEMQTENFTVYITLTGKMSVLQNGNWKFYGFHSVNQKNFRITSRKP